MNRARLLVLAVLACLSAGPVAAREPPGPWVRLMTWDSGVVGREARPASVVADGLETRIIIVWGTPQADGGAYMLGRLRVDCGGRQASVMEAVSVSLEGEELARESRTAPSWADGPPGTPVAALIGVLCGGDAPVEDGPLYADVAAFVEAARG
jgi:hypothetical protein